MKYYLFNVWSDNEDGYREVLVKALTQHEAENKLADSDITYDDYEVVDVVFDVKNNEHLII
ncbi:hypothetical protein [Clostridium botulinum]|uniref:hypothetical protein n=1 Tax=Clostridium botulinum TaxID=1491 RepID=UPI00388D94E5